MTSNADDVITHTDVTAPLQLPKTSPTRHRLEAANARFEEGWKVREHA